MAVSVTGHADPVALARGFHFLIVPIAHGLVVPELILGWKMNAGLGRH